MGYREEVLADGPLGYWRLGEASGTVSNDETTNNRDLSLRGSPTLGIAGALSGNTAINFPTSSTYADSNGVASFTLTDTFSIETWVKRSDLSASPRGIFVLGSNGSPSLAMNASGGIVLSKRGTGVVVTSNVNITDTSWHYVVATKSGATVRIYIDGVNRTGTVSNLTFASITHDVYWARGYPDGTTGTYGLVALDEPAIHPSALSLARVQAHYNAASTPPDQSPPTASFTVSGTGLSRTFTDTSTDPDGTIVSRAWAFGDGGTSTATNPSHTYAGAGTYTVSLTVTDDDGATGDTQQNVAIAANVPPIANFSFNTSGLVANFTDSSSDPDGTVVSRAWNFGDTGTSTATNPSHTYASGGTYDVTLTVTDDRGGTGQKTSSVTVSPLVGSPPSASFTVSGTGLSRTFTDTSTDPDGTIASRAWNFGDSTTSTATNPSHTYAGGGTYTVTLTVTDNSGNPATTQQTVTLTAPPLPSSTAFLEKSFPSSPYEMRYGHGLALKNRMPTWPTNGSVSIHPLCRPDGTAFAWIDASTSAEVAELTITQQPVSAGNVAITLGGVLTNVSVVATPEVASLSLTTPPTSPGTVTVSLGGTSYPVIVGGTQEVFTLRINSKASTFGYVTLTLDGVARRTQVGPRATTAQVASAIRAAGYPGWSITQSGTTLTFTANLPGPRTDPTFSAGTTGLTYSLNVTTQGAAETANQLADRIRATNYSGWITGGTTNTITFTATQGGARTDATYSPGNTGASGTMTTTQQGAVDTAAQVAARIRSTVFTGWTVSGSGTTARFTANTAGVRQNANYASQGTGAIGTIATLVQGSNLDLIAVLKDASGQTYNRKIMAGLLTSTIFNTDITVSGAGTDKAIVTFWGSTGTNPLVHLERFEEVDLTDYPAGILRPGVFAESSNTLTWDLHVDDLYVTNLGRNYFEDHNELGVWLNQLHGDYADSQPIRQDLLLQDGYAAVIPGATYAVSARMRHADIPEGTLARPLTLTAYSSNGTATPLADLAAVSGTAGWTTYNLSGAESVTIPPLCYVLGINSKDVGAGEFVIQRITVSEGVTPKRTGLYATSGSYRSTLAVGGAGTEGALPHRWSVQRRRLDADVEVPDGCAAITSYGASDARTGPFSAFTSDAALVPEGLYVQAETSMVGTGLATPVLKPGFPLAEYILTLGLKPDIEALLRADRTELPGGSLFSELEEWSKRPVGERITLPSGRLHDLSDPFAAVGLLPESELQVFSLEAKRYVEEQWKELFVVEAFGEVLTVKLSAGPNFKRMKGTGFTKNDKRVGVWVAKIAPCEVVEVGILP